MEQAKNEMNTAPITVLDVEEKRSYKVSDSFIAEVDSLFWLPGWSKHILAANGGLIYTMYTPSSITSTSKSHQIHIVCNPVSRSYHEITQPKLYFPHERDIVLMSVDNETKTYKILIMQWNYSSPYGEHPYLYDSTTSAWKQLSEAPRDGYYVYSSAFMNGILYTLFVVVTAYNLDWLRLEFYSCDLATGAWQKVDLNLPTPWYPEHNFLLVVSMNRLFMVEYTRIQTWGLKEIVIWEVVLARKEVVKVAEMKKFSKCSSTMPQRPGRIMGEVAVAVGCAESIVISCEMGQRLKYDLSKECWHNLPASPTYTEHFRGTLLTQGICAGLVDF